MKRCPSCFSLFESGRWVCPRCGWRPPVRDGVIVLSGDGIGAGEGYDPAWYDELARLEEGNFWFVARNRLIRWLAERHCAADTNYLEIGCGTGFVLQMLRQAFTGWTMSATEVFAEGLQYAMHRTPGIEFYQMDARAIPFRGEFDVVGAFDVIEHIREDEDALREVHRALRSDGRLLLSVPQHMFLWSQFDEIGCHFRRYSMRQLDALLEKTGFEVLETTSFNTFLLPLMILSRARMRRAKDIDVLDELRVPRLLNKLLSATLQAEFASIRMGARWPAGGSRMVVARRVGS